MDGQSEVMNQFLVKVFNEILRSEERSLASRLRDLSLRELHLIEEVCLAVDEGRDNRATAIAAAQRVTGGTLTTAVSLLEKKGYLERQRDERDRRAVRICPTEKARRANEVHTQFHREMVARLVTVLKPEESAALVKALGCLAAFFREQFEQH